MKQEILEVFRDGEPLKGMYGNMRTGGEECRKTVVVQMTESGPVWGRNPERC